MTYREQYKCMSQLQSYQQTVLYLILVQQKILQSLVSCTKRHCQNWKRGNIGELLTNNCKPIPLGTETVKSTAGTLKSIDHVEGSNSFTSFHVSTQYSAGKQVEAWAHRLACSV